MASANPTLRLRPCSCTKPLARDLLAEGVVLRLDLVCAVEYLIDLCLRDHDGARGIGEHVEAGHHTHLSDHHGDIGESWRHLVSTPAGRLTGAVGGEVV